MIYKCKKCGSEIALFEIDFTGESFCLCGGQEMSFLRTHRGKLKSPVVTDSQRKLQMILEGVRDHYKND